jgi:hypothetical protein
MTPPTVHFTRDPDTRHALDELVRDEGFVDDIASAYVDLEAKSWRRKNLPQYARRRSAP